MPYDKIDQLYDALKADGAVSKDRKNFRNVMLAPGRDGYQNRKRLFDALKADGAVDSNSYEEFAQRLGLHAVKPAGQKAPHAGTPMTGAGEIQPRPSGFGQLDITGMKPMVYQNMKSAEELRGDMSKFNSNQANPHVRKAVERGGAAKMQRLSAKSIERAKKYGLGYKDMETRDAAIHGDADAQRVLGVPETMSQQKDELDYYNVTGKPLENVVEVGMGKDKYGDITGKPLFAPTVARDSEGNVIYGENGEPLIGVSTDGNRTGTYRQSSQQRINSEKAYEINNSASHKSLEMEARRLFDDLHSEDENIRENAIHRIREIRTLGNEDANASLLEAFVEIQREQNDAVWKQASDKAISDDAANAGTFAYAASHANPMMVGAAINIKNPDLTTYEAIDNTLAEAESHLKEFRKEQDEQNANWLMRNTSQTIRGIGSELFDLGNWDFGRRNLGESTEMLKAVEAVQNGTATEAQQRMLKVAALKNQIESDFELSAAYDTIGRTTGKMASFAADIALGGMPAAGKKVGTALVKTLTRNLPKIAMKKMGERSFAITGRLAGDLIDAGMTTFVVQNARVQADAINRHLGQADGGLDENGTLAYIGHQGGKEWREAIVDASTAAFIENASEGWGDYLSPMGKTIGHLTGKALGKVHLGAVNRFFAGVGKSEGFQMYSNLRKRMKLNGPIEEFAEEMMGNTANALTVGDQSLDEVWNWKNVGRTAMALSLGCGFFSTVGGGLYIKDIANGKRKMTKAASAAGAVFGNKWTDVKTNVDKELDNAISAGGDHDIAEHIMDNGYTLEQKQALLDYANRRMYYRGMLYGANANLNDKNTSDAERQAVASYTRGLDLDDTQALTDAKTAYELQQQKIAEKYGEDAIAYADDNPVGYLHQLQQQGADEEVQGDFLAYINAKSAFDGVIQRAQDDLDDRITESDAMIDSRMHRQDGAIHPATMKYKDRKVYVVSGNVVMSDDGTMVDNTQSDDTLIIRDAETGELEFSDPASILSVDETIDPEEEKAAAAEAITQTFGKERADQIDGVLPMLQGDTYNIVDDEGKPHTVQVVQNNGDGSLAVMLDGAREAVPMTAEQLQAWADNANVQRVRQQEEEAVAALQPATTETETGNGRPTYSINDEITLRGEDGLPVRGSVGAEENADGLIEVYTESPIKGKKVNMFTRDELDGMLMQHNGEDVNAGMGVAGDAGAVERPQEDAQESAPANAGKSALQDGTTAESMPMIGEGEDAEPDFSRVDPTRAHTYIYNEAGLDREEGNEFVAANLKEAQKALDKAKKGEPKMGTSIAKYRKEQAAYGQIVGEAQKMVDYWNGVKAEQDKIVAEESRVRAEQQAEDTRKAVEAERQRKEAEAQKAAEQAEVGTHNVAPAIKEKWDAARKIEGAANEIVLPNGEKVAGRYVLVESGAASPSHNATNEFTKTEGFPIDENGQSVNDRDYERDKDAQRITRNIASDYDSRAMQSPVVVSRDGVVLSGNGRTMAGELAATNNTDGAYIEHLQKYPQQYGFTPEQVQGMEHPRVLFVPDADMPYTAETFAKYNQQEMKGQSKTEHAVKLGKVVDDATFNRIIRLMNQYDTLGDFYADSKATHDAIGELQTAGVVAPAQVAEMFDGDGISAQGREMLENMLIGKAFESNPDAVRQITAFKSMRQSVITALAEISNNKALGDGYSLEKELADAIALVYNARNDKYKAGERVSEYARQGNLFQLDDGATVADFTNATTMMLADVLNDNRSTQLKKILAVYNHNAADSAAGQMDMFSGGVLTKRDILNEVKQLINYGTEQQQTEAIGQAVERRKAESIQQDGDTRGSGKKEPAYRLSDEVDENGRQFVLTSEGKLEFGELGAETGLPPAPIMLSEGIITNPKTNDGYGLVHIEARHGEQIRNAGYSSVLDFIEEVAKHYEVIKEGKNRNGNQTYMLQLTDKHNNTLMVEMSADGNYWNINTAGIFKTSYGKNRKEVYNRHTTAKQPAGTVGVSQDSEQDGTQKSSSMNTPSTSSASKDSKSSEIKQKYEDIFAKAERIARESEVKRKITEAEKETDVNPTEAQKEAGNYKKGHVTVDGLDVTIEQPKGSVRRGKDADGKEWESEMHNTYGYIKGAEGVDGDHIDIFLSDNPASGHVFVVDQVNPKTGEFDEHKVMYGFDSAEEAKQAYLSNYEKGWKGLGDITEVTKEKFKKWVDSSKRKTKPFAEYKNVKGTSDVNEAATASQRTERTGGKQVGADVPAMTEEKYLASKGLGSPMSDYMLDKMRIPHGETARQMAKRKQEAERAMEEHAAQKEAARKEYREKIANGELREPTKEEAEQKRIDALVKTANGHDDNPSVQAARRVLDKRGIEWKKNEDIFTRAERIAQDVANKKKLEKREPTKAGKIPQEEKEDLLSQKEYVDNGMSSALEQTQYKTLEEWEDKDTEDYARKYDDFLADYTNYINDFAKGETLQALYDKSSVKVQKEIRRHIEDAGLDYHDILDTSPGRIRIQDRLTKKMKYAKGEFSDGTIVAGEVVSQTPTSLVINSRGRKYTIKAGSVLEQSDEPIASSGILFRDGEQEYTKEEREVIANAKADGSYMKAPNGKSTKLTEHQWVQVRTKAFKEWFGDWEKAARIEKLRKSKAVKITGEEIVPSDDLKQYKKNALEYGKKLRGEYTNEDTGESIALTGGNSRGGIREILQHDYKDTEHLQSIAAIPQIIEKSIFIDDIPNEDVEKYSGVKSFRYYVCGLKIGNNDYTVKAVVAVQNNGDRYYDHKLSRIEKGKLLSIIPTIQKAGIENNLPPSIGKDKRLFSILQTNSSKVLDENGEPMVVYHGTNTEFTAFDRKKAGASNDAGMRGKGFYLSPNKRTSENYGQRIISAFVSLKNPFIPFSFSSSKEIAEYLGVEEDTFRFEPNSEFKVYPAFSGLITSALKDKGYDGVLYLHRQEIVAFRPDQIKSATDNNGEFDAGNDDIRFRKTEQAGYTAKQREEYDLRQRRRIQDAARETASKLGIGDRVTMMETADGLTGRRAKAKGWFDTETGKIVVVLGNHRNREDVMQTILHEGVAHYGLRQLFGPHFDTFLDNVRRNADEDVRRAIVEMAAKHGWDFRTATEEYLAGLAEDTDFERAMNRGWFNRIKDLFLKMLHKIGFEGFTGVELSDNELRYILWRSYENLTEPGRYRSILGEAADVDMQSRLKVGNYQVQQTGDGDLAAEPAPIGNGAFGPIYDQFRGKAKEAISFLTRKKAGEAVGALHHKDIGDIDLVWGNGKAGLAHILSKHPNVLDGIQDFINEMEVVQSSENRIVIESDSHRAVISKMLGQEKTPQWLLTAYAKKNATGGSSDIDPEPNQGKQNGTAPLQGNSSSANIGNVLESSKEPDEKVLFRDGGEPQRTAREIYEDAVKDSGEATMLGALSRTLTQDGRERFKHKLSESHFDYTRSIKQMQDAISKALGIKIESFEDVWRNLNAKGSIDAQEINMTMLRYIAPLAEHIGGMLKGKKLNGAELTQDDVEVYMNAVHGIERNAAMAKRELERIVDNKLEVWMEARTQELLAQGYNHDEAESIVEAERESQYKEEAKKVANKVRKDYAGLTALFGDEVEASGGKRTDIGKLEEAARKYAQEFESVIGKEQTDEMWNLVKALNDFSLRKAYMSGLIGKKQYDETRTMYTHYVPLRGWHDDFAGDIYQYISRGESKEVLQNVLKKAYGRQSRAGNIMGTMAAMANTAIVQGNKNLVAQKFLNLALNFGDKSGLLAVSRQWYEKNANGELIPLHPELRDNMTADEMQRAIEEFDARMEAEKKNGNTRLVKRTFGQDMPMHIAKWQEQQHSVRVLRNGVEYQVYVLGNPKAAQAFNGALLKNSDYGKVQEVWMNWMRLKATMQTSLSPEFLFSNFQRDILTAGTGTYIKFGWKAGTAFADNLTKVMPVSGLRKGHAGGIFELLRKYNNGTLDKTNEMERMFDEFVRGGGMTGISSITKNEEYERQMAKMMKRVNRGSLDMPRKAWQGLADGVEFLNSGIENATRFAAYMTSRKTLGKSVAESVFDAKEASVNFNMKGSGAWGNLWIRRNILYANPALQALRMLGTWYEASPARFMKAFATILAASVGTAALWAYIGGDGDDDDWWKLNEWNRYNYINIRTKGGYAHWSIPQEFRPIWALGQIVFDWQQGKITPSIAINSMITQLNNISPMAFFAGGLDSKDSFWKTAIKAWTPTIAEDFADVYHWNENFLGQKITGQSDWNKDAPEWKRAGKNTPEWAVGISRKWNEATGGRRNLKSWWDSEYLNPSAVYYILQQQTGGMGTMVTKLSKAYEQWQDPDEEVEPKNIPFVSKFWVTTGDDDSKNRVVNDKFWMFYNDWKLTDYEIKHNQSDVRKGDMTLGELAEDMSEIKADGSFDRWRKLQEAMKYYHRLQQAKKDGVPGIDEKIQELKNRVVAEMEAYNHPTEQ